MYADFLIAFRLSQHMNDHRALCIIRRLFCDWYDTVVQCNVMNCNSLRWLKTIVIGFGYLM
jgi:hypothetical protein